jgi:hypothetical protein
MTDSVTHAQNIGSIHEHLKQFLFSPLGIRTRAQQIYQRALDGKTHFQINEHKLAAVTAFVLQVIESNYPDRQVPYHSRWRHFEVGNRFQLNCLAEHSKNLDELDRARIGLDLILPSVLVDAGAGPDWSYSSSNSITVGRSEGLGLASLDMFLAGGFSHRRQIETTAAGLDAVSAQRFCDFFKVSEQNPLLGVAGRVQLLKGLGAAMISQPDIFPNARPGDLVDYVLDHYERAPSAENILQMVLKFFGNIWPGRLMLDGTNLGDTWVYSPLGNSPASYVPFHKLSQWISYSIIETLANNGFAVSGVEALTGLAEYRNGGLMLDSGLISLRDPSCAQTAWEPSSEIIIEWRALTVCLLDKIAEQITAALDTTPEAFPLAKVLEGGTWAAGRKLALQTRNNLTPPLQIVSDATVF